MNDTTLDAVLGGALLALLGGVGYAAYKGRPGLLGGVMRSPLGWAPGHVLNGRWVLGQQLGHGGMGVVFEAVDARNGAEVALKLPTTTMADWSWLEAEFKLMKQAGSVAPRAYELSYDFVTSAPFIVMERLNGATLSRDDGADVVLLKLKRLLPGVGMMHDRKVIHQDIKPENVFATTRGDVRLLDFGLANQRGAITPVGTGTPEYGAPEQIPDTSRSQIIPRTVYAHPAADIYGAGATARMLLSLDGTVGPCAPSLDSDVLPNQAPEVSKIVTKAMQCYPDKRWDSAYVMSDAMNQVLSDAYAKAGLVYRG